MSCQKFLKEEFRLVNLRLRHHEPHRFVNSQWSIVHTVIYVAYRWVIAIYLLAVSIASGVETGTASHLTFLTHWTFIALTLSHVVRACSAFYWAVAKKCKRKTSADVDESEDHLPWYLKLLWVLFNTTGPPSLTVTMLYWGILYDVTQGMTFLNFAVHGSNSIVVILDHFVTGVPMKVLHFHHPVIYGVLYSVFTGIYYAASDGEYVYNVLDFKTDPGLAVGILLGSTFVLIPLLHLLLFGLFKFREFLGTKCENGTVSNEELTERSTISRGVEMDNPGYTHGGNA